MTLYTITFTNGKVVEEYGDSVADITNFCAMCYKDSVIATIVPY